MSTLVVYYSRSGHTKAVALRIRDVLGADLEALRDARNRAGVRGYVRSTIETLLRLPTSLRATELDPSRYDLVVVGTPVWGGSMSSPVRTWLEANRDRLRTVAFFCTMEGPMVASTFRQMATASGREPVAVLSLRTSEMAGDSPRLGTFVARLAQMDGTPVRRGSVPLTH
jgi:flavodoxin